MDAKCYHCGCIIERHPKAHHTHRSYCEKPECVEAKAQWLKERKRAEKQRHIEKVKRVNPHARNPDAYRVSHGVVRRRSGKAAEGAKIRYCLGCGMDAYPNWFYCPTCHGRVSDGVDCDLMEAAGFGGGRHTMFGRRESRLTA